MDGAAIFEFDFALFDARLLDLNSANAEVVPTSVSPAVKAAEGTTMQANRCSFRCSIRSLSASAAAQESFVCRPLADYFETPTNRAPVNLPSSPMSGESRLGSFDQKRSLARVGVFFGQGFVGRTIMVKFCTDR